MSDLKFIQETPSDELYKYHLKDVFKVYHDLFGEVCTGCPTKIAGYIKRIKNYKKTKVMSKKSKFILKKGSQIIQKGSSKSYSNANLTDELAIEFLKKNPNRKVLFAKLPENVDELIASEDEKVLKDYKVSELRVLYPDAKGRTKAELIASIEESIANTEATPEAPDEEE